MGSETVFVVFNTASTSQTLTNLSTTFTAGTTILNLLDTNETVTITSTPETPAISVAATTAKIFIAQSDWKPIDPVVVSNWPAHDAPSVGTYSPVVLQFSKPMDTNSVQAAFGTIPSVTGTFSWSAARDTLTFNAGGAGFPALTNILVRVTNSAVDAISGNAMFSPYELLFHTAAVSDGTAPAVSLLTPTNGAVVSGNLVILGTATDNVAVRKVEIQMDSGSWLTATGRLLELCSQ